MLMVQTGKVYYLSLLCLEMSDILLPMHVNQGSKCNNFLQVYFIRKTKLHGGA